MTMQQEHDGLSAGADVSAADRELVVERVRFLFRQVGDNPPAREMEQQILTYRLERKQQ